MRTAAFALLLLTACAPEQTKQPPADSQTYAGPGRDRLCIKGERAGFIAFGEGDSNCSVRGRIERDGDRLAAIRPDGDEDCRIPAERVGEAIRLGKAGDACAYYCGPGASFDGKTFTQQPSSSPAADFAGDALC